MLLLRLYECAMLLPETSPPEYDAPRIGHEEWKAMFNSIGAGLPGHDSYWVAFEPVQLEPPNPIVGSLADAVADTWRDIRVGLLLIDSGGLNSRDAAVREWHFAFLSHWGRHAVEAIAVLHALCVDSSSRVDGI
jgi:hypothetical protein